MDVVGIGALNHDRLLKVKRIAEAGEEVGVESMTVAPGGSSANTIVGLARLGMSTGFIGRVGNDEEGEFILNDLKNEGVDITAVVVEKGSTGIILAFVDENGERVMYAHPGVNDDVRISESNLEYAKRAKYLHLSSFVGETSFRAQQELIKKLKGVSISFSPGMLYVRKNRDEIERMIASTEVMFMNEDETKIFTGSDYENGADELLNLGAKMAVITLGGKGCYIATADECSSVEKYQASVVDTTGAGDAFAAGFLYGLLKEKSLLECGRMGNWIASRCIGSMGARAGLPWGTDFKHEFG
ncbi:MAG: carbohydrate kinase family protein [Candidatus Hydrothermarchaeales archaeon]